MVDEPYTKRLWPMYRRADTRVGPYEELDRWTEGDYAHARLRYVMIYKVKERALMMPVEYGHFVVFDLPIGKRPEPTDTYTDWQKPVGMGGSVCRSANDRGYSRLQPALEGLVERQIGRGEHNARDPPPFRQTYFLMRPTYRSPPLLTRTSFPLLTTYKSNLGLS